MKAEKIKALLSAAAALLILGFTEPGHASECRSLVRSVDQVERLSDFPLLSPQAQWRLRGSAAALSRWEQRRQSGRPVLVISVNSFNLDKKEVATIDNYLHYEQRALWNILRARDRAVRVLYVSSDPVPSAAIDHLLSTLPAAEAKAVRSRLEFLALGDRRRIYLTDKLLENPAWLNRLRAQGEALLGEPMTSENSLLFPYNVTPEVVALAERMGVGFVGLSPVLTNLNTKSLNHEVFSLTSVPQPETVAHVTSERSIAERVLDFFERNQLLQRVFTKTNKGTSGQGIFDVSREELIALGYRESLSKPEKIRLILKALRQKRQNGETWDEVLPRTQADGAVVQEGIPHTRGPSAQLFIHGDGRAQLLSTHQQRIVDKAYVGSSYPAYPQDLVLQRKLESYAHQVAQVFARLGVRGRLAFDFFEVEKTLPQGGVLRDLVIGEANIREGGTTHAWETLQRLLDATHDPQTGAMRSGITGEPVFYVMTDGFKAPWLKGMSSEQVFSLLKDSPLWAQLSFRRSTGKGVLLHMTEAIGEFGSVGYVAAATTPERAQALFDQMEFLLRSLKSSTETKASNSRAGGNKSS